MDIISNFVGVLEDTGIEVRRNVLGSILTTYHIGGILKYYIVLSSRHDVETVSSIITSDFIGQLDPRLMMTIGKGSNILVSDSGFDGCVFSCEGSLAEVGLFNEQNGNCKVEVGAGTALGSFARQCVPIGCGGLSFYVGIPGSVGGAVVMNAGGHGRQTSEVLVSCDVLNTSTGEITSYSNQECNFSYRCSRFHSDDIIYSASFLGSLKDPNEIKTEIDEIVRWRRDHQPGGRNVGSVFQNPQGYSSGELIEKCGLKGFRIGGAYVSDKHANFIQAEEGAFARDVKKLIEHIKVVVLNETGVKLETEVRFVGDYEDE